MATQNINSQFKANIKFTQVAKMQLEKELGKASGYTRYGQNSHQQLLRKIKTMSSEIDLRIGYIAPKYLGYSYITEQGAYFDAYYFVENSTNKKNE